MGGLTVNGTASANGPATVSGQLSAQAVQITGDGNSLYVRNGQIFTDTGNRNAAQFFNTSNQFPTGWFQNRSGRTGNYVTGAVGYVVQRDDYGLYTNGRIASGGGLAALTQVGAQGSQRVVTSPLALDAVLYITGSAQAPGSTCFVDLDPAIAGLICYSADAPYHVQCTSSGGSRPCSPTCSCTTRSTRSTPTAQPGRPAAPPAGCPPMEMGYSKSGRAEAGRAA